MNYNVWNKIFSRKKILFGFKKNVILLIFSLFAQLIVAQTFNLIGQVVNEEGEELIGVNIQIKGSDRGTSTDIDGNFAIADVDENTVLIISYIGYVTQEVLVGQNSNLTIILLSDAQLLDEVVVVGFGTQRKITTVGAQTTINPEELRLPVRNLTNTLMGRLAGVTGVQRSGLPGTDDAEIFIRGIATLNKGLSRPLFLVDGIERPISDVDPDNIESLTVLKDASATSIYGVRGANGVILINTKKGNIGRPKVQMRYFEGMSSYTTLPDMVDGMTYMNLANEASFLRGGAPIFDQETMEKTASGEDPYLYPNVDWMGTLFSKWASTRNAKLNISGGSENATYYMAAGYFFEDGITKVDPSENYDSRIFNKRYNFLTNLVLNVTKTTEVTLGIQGDLSNRQRAAAEIDDIMDDALNISPVLYPIKYPRDTLAESAQLRNPFNTLTQKGFRTGWDTRLYTNVNLNQKLDFILKGLSFRTLFSFDARSLHWQSRVKNPDKYLASGRDIYGNLILTQTYSGSSNLGYSSTSSGERAYYTQSSLNYSKTLNAHEIGGMLLFNQRDFEKTTSDFVQGLPYRYRGYAGRATYSYDDRYLFEANFGYNASENFSPKNRYGFFPSVGMGWVISEEPFFEKLQNQIQFLKIRGTHGLVGNSEIGGRRFGFIGTVGSTNIGFMSDDVAYRYIYGNENADVSYDGIDVDEYPSDITWETATKSDIGIELGLLKNNLNIQFDYFRELRKGILIRRQSLPNYLGVQSAPYGNIGIVANRGFDANVEFIREFGDLRVQVQGNITYAENKIVENDEPDPRYPWMDKKGYSTTSVFGYVAEGLFRDSAHIEQSAFQNGDVRPGDIKFKDINGDGVIDSYDRQKIGYGNYPLVMYGFGFTLQYNGFTFGSFFQGADKVSIYLSGEGFQPFRVSTDRGNVFTAIEDRWTPENPDPNAFYPRLAIGTINQNYERNTWFMKDGKYLRLKTLQLAYDLPERISKKASINRASIIFVGNNVLTISGFKLYDVEMGNGRGQGYPNMTNYSIGVELNF